MRCCSDLSQFYVHHSFGIGLPVCVVVHVAQLHRAADFFLGFPVVFLISSLVKTTTSNVVCQALVLDLQELSGCLSIDSAVTSTLTIQMQLWATVSVYQGS